MSTTLYDAVGRHAATLIPGGGMITNVYNLANQLTMQWGSGTVPRGYSYDPLGRMHTLTTWQDFANDAGQAVTTWNYNDLGQLASKVYTDGATLSYTYTDAGRNLTSSRANANTTTTHLYNPAGLSAGRSYSDSTPAVHILRDRLGRPKRVEDAVGTRRFEYATHGPVAAEEFEAGPFTGTRIARPYDGLLRPDGLDVTQSGSLSYAIDYTPDSTSRIGSISGMGGSVSYTFEPGTGSVATKSVLNSAGANVFSEIMSWDTLGRLTGLDSGDESFTLSYNLRGLIDRREDSDGTHWEYDYDELHQLTSGTDSTPTAGCCKGRGSAMAMTTSAIGCSAK